jgi:hypothetical protein
MVDGSTLEVTVEVLYGRVYLTHVAVDGTRTDVMRSLDVRLMRLDTVRVTIAAAVGALGIEATSGGRRKGTDRMQGRHFYTLPAIDGLHLGAPSVGSQVPLEVLRVSLWPDVADIDVGIEVDSGPVYCLADLDEDGLVGGSDILILLTGWGTCPTGDGKTDPPPCIADLTDDGFVDVHDLLFLLTSLGECNPD